MKTYLEIIHASRDRSSEHTSAVSAAAPQAIQVADRFHVAKACPKPSSNSSHVSS
jgi:transposase